MSTGLLNQGQRRGEFYAGLESGMAARNVEGMFLRTSSSVETESYAYMRSAPMMKKRQRPVSVKQMVADLISGRNEPYQAVSEFDRDAWRRDQTGLIDRRIREHGDRASALPWKLATEVIESNPVIWDGQNFFDTDHNESGSNQTNVISTTQAPAIAVVDSTNPTPEEAVEALVQCIAHAKSIVDDEGEPINETAADWLIVAKPGAISAAFDTAVSANILSSNRTNTLNASGQNILGGGRRVRLLENARLTGSSKTFYLARVDGSQFGRAPFILQEEVAPEIEIMAEGTESWIKDRKGFVSAFWSGVIIPLDWTQIFKSTLVDA